MVIFVAEEVNPIAVPGVNPLMERLGPVPLFTNVVVPPAEESDVLL
jgi:hypothetical protein